MDGNKTFTGNSPDDANKEDTLSTSSSIESTTPFHYVFEHEADLTLIAETKSNASDDEVTTPSTSQSHDWTNEKKLSEPTPEASTETSEQLNPPHDVMFNKNKSNEDQQSSPSFNGSEPTYSSTPKSTSQMLASAQLTVLEDEFSPQTSHDDGNLIAMDEKLRMKNMIIDELKVQNKELRNQIVQSAASNTPPRNVDYEKAISNLKLELAKKETEIEHLTIGVNSFKQTKQVLKDTTWALRVKEEELRNIKADMRENYEKRLSELMQRLNDREFKLSELQSKNIELVEKESDHTLRIDELHQQVHLLKEELQTKEQLIELSVRGKELSEKEYNAQVGQLTTQLDDMQTSLIDLQTSKDEEKKTLQSEKDDVERLLQERVSHMEMQSAAEILQLQNELNKSQCQVNELVMLLEGVNTDQPHVPTVHLSTTPIDLRYLVKKSLNDGDNDSFGSVDDLRSEEFNKSEDFSDCTTSLKQQMCHTVSKYEQQIEELQLLYDQDVAALEKDKLTNLERIVALESKLGAMNQSKEMSSLNADDLQESYEMKIVELKDNFDAEMQQEQSRANMKIQELREDNQKLASLLYDAEKNYEDVFEKAQSAIEAKLINEDGLESSEDLDKHEVTELIEQQLQDDLMKIKEEHNDQLMALETNYRAVKQEKDAAFEERYLSEIVQLQDEKNNLHNKVAALEAELSSIKWNYDNLQTHLQVSRENSERKMSESESGVIEETSPDILVKTDALHDELTRLRQNFNNTKLEVEDLRKERSKFTSLNDALSKDLQDLQSELERNSTASMMMPPDFNSTLQEVEQLKQENGILLEKLNKTGCKSEYSVESVIEEVPVRPLYVAPVDAFDADDDEYAEEFDDFLLPNTGSKRQVDNVDFLRESLLEKSANERELGEEIERLTDQVRMLENQLQINATVEGDEKKIQDLEEELLQAGKLSNHLQEMFSQQLLKLQQQNQSLTDDLEKARQKLKVASQLSNEKERLELLLGNEKITATECMERAEALQLQLDQERSSLGDIKRQLASAESALMETDLTKDNSQNEMEILQNKLTVCQREISELNNKLKQQTELCDKLNDECRHKDLELLDRERSLKLQFEEILQLSKDNMSAMNSEGLNKLRHDLDSDHQKQQKGAEDMLHEEYAKRIVKLTQDQDNEVVNLRAHYEGQLIELESSLLAEKENQIRTVRSVMERSNAGEIERLNEQHDAEMHRLRNELEEEHQENKDNLHVKLMEENEAKLNNLEALHSKLSSEMLEETKRKYENVKEKEFNDLKTMLTELFDKEKECIEETHEVELKQLQEQQRVEFERELNEKLSELKASHEKEKASLERKTKEELDEVFEKKLLEKLQEQKVELEGNFKTVMEEEEIKIKGLYETRVGEQDLIGSACVEELRGEHNETVKALLKEFELKMDIAQSEQLKESDRMKENYELQLRDLESEKMAIEGNLIEVEKALSEKEQYYDGLMTEMLDSTHKDFESQTQKMEEEHNEELRNLDELTKKQLDEAKDGYELRCRRLSEEKDNEIKMLENLVEEFASKNAGVDTSTLNAFYEDRISELQAQFDDLKTKNELEVIDLYEKIEERRGAEEELHLKSFQLKKDLTLEVERLNAEHRGEMEAALKAQKHSLDGAHQRALAQLSSEQQEDLEMLRFNHKDEILQVKLDCEQKIVRSVALAHAEMVLKNSIGMEKMRKKYSKEIEDLDNQVALLKNENKELQANARIENDRSTEATLDKIAEDYVVLAIRNSLISVDDGRMMVEEESIQETVRPELCSEIITELLDKECQTDMGNSEFPLSCSGDCKQAKVLEEHVKKVQQDLERFLVTHDRELALMLVSCDKRVMELEEQLETSIRGRVKAVVDNKILEYNEAKEELLFQQQALLDEFTNGHDYELTELQKAHETEVAILRTEIESLLAVTPSVVESSTSTMSTDELTMDACTNTLTPYDGQHEEVNAVELREQRVLLEAETHEKLTEQENKYEEMMADLENDYGEKIKSIENEYDEKLVYLENEHTEKITNIDNENVKKLRELEIQYKERLLEENEKMQSAMELKEVEKLEMLAECREASNKLIEQMIGEHSKNISNVKHEYDTVIQQLNEDFEKQKVEEIKAVIASIENETQKVNEDLVSAHENEIEEVKDEVRLLTAQLEGQENLRATMKTTYQEVITKVKESHKEEMMELQSHHQKQTNDLEKLLKETVEEKVIIDEKLHNVQNQLKELVDNCEKELKAKSTKIEVEFEEARMQFSDELKEKDEAINKLENDLKKSSMKEKEEVGKLEEKIETVKKENEILEDRLKELENSQEKLSTELQEVTSQNEVMFERHDRQQQEGSNHLQILQNDVQKLSKERDDILFDRDQVMTSMRSLLTAVSQCEQNIHKRLDDMIEATISNDDIKTVPGDGVNTMPDTPQTDSSTLLLQNDLTLLDDTIDKTTPQQAVDVASNIDLRDPGVMKDVGHHLFTAVDHLLQMLSDSSCELNVNRAAYSNLLANYETVKEQNANLEHANKHFSDELGVSQVKYAEVLSNLEEEKGAQDVFKTEIADMVTSKQELESQLEILKSEIVSANENTNSREQELLKMEEAKSDLELECQSLKEITERKYFEIENMANKLQESSEMNEHLLNDKKHNEVMIADLKSEFENERFSRQREDMQVYRKVSQTTFDVGEENKRLRQELESLNEVVRELTDEKLELRSQMLDSGYSQREDSMQTNMTKIASENDALLLKVQHLAQDKRQLESALNEALHQKRLTEESLLKSEAGSVKRQVKEEDKIHPVKVVDVTATEDDLSTSMELSKVFASPVQSQDLYYDHAEVPSRPALLEKLAGICGMDAESFVDQDLKEQISALEEHFYGLQTQYTTLLESNAMNTESQEKLIEQVQSQQIKLDERDLVIAKLENTNEMKVSEVEEFKVHLKAERTAAEAMKEELMKTSAEKENLSKLIGSLRQESCDKDVKCSLLSKEVAELSAKLDVFMDERSLYERQKQCTVELEVRAKQHQREMETVKHEKTAEVDALRELVSELRDALNAKKDEVYEQNSEIRELRSESEQLHAKLNTFENADETSSANVTVNDRLMNLLQRQKMLLGSTRNPNTDANVKVLLNDVQNEAEEVLDLVLSFPQLNEILISEHLNRQTNAWNEEKQSLLSVIDRQNELLTEINESKDTVPTSSFLGERRVDSYKKEHKAMRASRHSENADILSLSEDKGIFLKDLSDVDRHLLVDEIMQLRQILTNKQNEESPESRAESTRAKHELFESRNQLAARETEVKRLKDELELEKMESSKEREKVQDEVLHVNQLKEQLLSAQVSLESLKGLLQTQRESLDSMASEGRVRKSDLNDANERCSSLEVKLKRVSDEKEAARDLLHAHKVELEKCEQEKFEWKMKHVELGELLKQERYVSVQKLEDVREMFDEERAEYERKQGELNVQLSVLRHRADELTKEGETKRKQVEHLEELQVRALQEREQDFERRQRDFENRRESFERREDGLEQRVENLDKREECLVHRANDLKAEIELSVDRCTRLDAREAELSVRVENIHKQLVGVERMESELKRQKQMIDDELGKLESESRQFESAVKMLKKKETFSEERLDARRKELDIKEKKLLVKEGKLQQVKESMAQEKEALTREKHEIENVKREAQQQKFDEARQVTALNEGVKEENAKLKDGVKELENKLSHYREHETRANSLRAELENERDRLSDQLVKSNDELAALRVREVEREKIHACEKRELENSLKSTMSNDVSEDGRKLLKAGWTIAKVQRLYLKYFRSESFRKALSYQKAYLSLLMTAQESSDVGSGTRRDVIGKQRFRVCGHVVIAVQRMQFLVRKYKRNLYKSSADYPYKEVRKNKLGASPPVCVEDLVTSSGKALSSINRLSDAHLASWYNPHMEAVHRSHVATTNETKQHSGTPSNRFAYLTPVPVSMTYTNTIEEQLNNSPTASANYHDPFTIQHSSDLSQSSLATGSTFAPPRSYPRPSPTRRHASPPVRDVEPNVQRSNYQDANASLNQYIRKLESLQTKLREQSSHFEQDRTGLVT